MQEISVLPGRIRLRASELYRNRDLAEYIDAFADSLYGIKYSRANYLTSTILIVYDTEKTEYKTIRQNIENAINKGFRDDIRDVAKYDNYLSTLGRRERAKDRFFTFSSLYLLIESKRLLAGKFSPSRSLGALQVASVATVIEDYPLFKKLYKKLFRWLPIDPDRLLTLTALSFTLLRESTEGVLLLALSALNDYIKFNSNLKSQRMLNQTLGKTPTMTWVVTGDSNEVLIPITALKTGDTISIHEGEIITADGSVIRGEAIISSLYHIGQPIITHIGEGNTAYEGGIILSGNLKIKVKELPDIKAKKDMDLENLQIQRRIEAYSNRITVTAIFASISNYLWTKDILNTLSLFMVLSPSATEAALNSGIKNYVSLLNKNRIYLRNENTIESIINTDNIVFDKTGTLTYGKMKIMSIEAYDGNYPKWKLVRICAACELGSYHPVSITLQEEVLDDYDAEKVESSVSISSRGVDSVYDGKRVLIGNRKLMDENGIELSKGIDDYTYYEQKLFTPIFVAIDNKLSGLIVMKDVLREGAGELISRLKLSGIKNISLLTGDNHEKASETATKLGIRTVYSEKNGREKVEVIKNNCGGCTVMMVGDGVNDQLAMKEADVSVSFANSACDKIKLDSDCIIFEDDITRLPDLITLSDKAYRSINNSITLTQWYSIIFGILTYCQCFTCFTAKVTHTVNSLTVVGFNYRIQFIKNNRLYSGELDKLDNSSN